MAVEPTYTIKQNLLPKTNYEKAIEEGKAKRKAFTAKKKKK